VGRSACAAQETARESTKMHNTVRRAGLLVQRADMGRTAASIADELFPHPAEHLLHASYVVIRDSGHATNLEQSASFNRIVLDFVASLERHG
jgi:pimeloyl-ACP methyl ester carboxylesterase